MLFRMQREILVNIPHEAYFKHKKKIPRFARDDKQRVWKDIFQYYDIVSNEVKYGR